MVADGKGGAILSTTVEGGIQKVQRVGPDGNLLWGNDGVVVRQNAS